MNQYSYGQPQPMYNPQTQNAYGFNTPYVSGINWAQGIEGAKAFRIKPNDMVIILDSENEGVMYIKTSDSIGMCTLRKFNYQEEITQPQNNSTDIDMTQYVKASELESKVEEIINRLLGGAKNEQPV